MAFATKAILRMDPYNRLDSGARSTGKLYMMIHHDCRGSSKCTYILIIDHPSTSLLDEYQYSSAPEPHVHFGADTIMLRTTNNEQLLRKPPM